MVMFHVRNRNDPTPTNLFAAIYSIMFGTFVTIPIVFDLLSWPRTIHPSQQQTDFYVIELQYLRIKTANLSMVLVWHCISLSSQRETILGRRHRAASRQSVLPFLPTLLVLVIL